MPSMSIFQKTIEDVIGEGNWQQLFTEQPEAFARSEQQRISGVAVRCLPVAQTRSSHSATISNARREAA